MYSLPHLPNSNLRDSDGQPVITYTEAKPREQILNMVLGAEQSILVSFDPETHTVSRNIGKECGQILIQPKPLVRAASG